MIPFWEEVNSLLSKIVNRPVHLDPLTHLSGLTLWEKNLKKLTTHIFTVARCLITARWKQIFPPMFSAFLQWVREVRSMAYIKARLCNTLAKFTAWDDYLALNVP